MQHDTQTIAIEASPEHTFAFVAEPENLTRWAAAFAKGMRRDGEGWVVTTPQGDVRMQYVTDRERGIIDYHIALGPGASVVMHSRVLPFGSGSLYVFTQEQAAGMPDAVFEAQAATLGRELQLLKSLLEVGSCAT
jgi:polyketide cyclase/dehydrase/lipid transport protein